MKLLSFICIVLFIIGCSDSKTYESDFYERVTKIKIPSNFTIIESFDNGEFVTATSFRASNKDLLNVIDTYKFKIADSNHKPDLIFSKHFFKLEKPNPKKVCSCIYYKWGSISKNNYIYIIDLQENILWAEVTYPDFGGS